MRNQMRHGLNGYVLSPYGDFGDTNVVGQIFGTIASLFGATPGTPSTGPTQQQIAAQQAAAAAAAAASQQKMLMYGGLAVGAVLLVVLVSRK